MAGKIEHYALARASFQNAPKVLIVVAPYYQSIAENLLKGAKTEILVSKGTFNIVEVPGALEIATAIGIAERLEKFDAYVALGCVIKGQTPHFDLICSSTFNAILQIAINFNKPIGNGIITALNIKQAINRSQKSTLKTPNKGSEAANAVLSVLINEPKKI